MLRRGRPLILGKRTEDGEQQLAMQRRDIHLLGQAAEGDIALAQAGDDVEQMRQQAAEPVQLPDDQAVTRPGERECCLKTGAIGTGTACLVLE